MATRYGMLPSEILSRATTFDLEVLDIAKSYEKYKHNKVNGVMPEIKEDVMLEVLRKAREG